MKGKTDRRSHKQSVKVPERVQFRKENALLILALAACFLSAYYPHFRNPFPIHVDEWQHLAQIISTSEGRPNFNPYIGEHHLDFEIVFHAFWAIPALVLGRERFILFSSFIPAILAVISGLCIYWALMRIGLTNSEAIMSVFAFATVKSGLNILGMSYFVPLSASIPFIFIFLVYFSRGVSENNSRNLLISILIFVMLFLIYPPSATILIPTILAYPLFFGSFLKRRAYQIVGFGIFMIMLAAASNLMKIGGRSAFSILVNSLVFRFGWGGYELKYSIPLLFTIPGTVLALFGAYFAAGDRKKLIFLISSISAVSIAFIFNKFNISLLAPYQRVSYYALIFMAPLAGIGLARVHSFLSERAGRIAAAGAVTFLLILMFLLRYPSESMNVDYAKPIMSRQAWGSLLWLSNNAPKGGVVMANFMLSSAVTPITGLRVQALLPAQLGTFDRQEERLEDSLKFYTNSTCEDKLKILNKWNVSTVLSDSRMDCLEKNGFYPSRSEGLFIYFRRIR